jgi:hypothetical protein
VSDFEAIIEHAFGSESDQIECELVGFNSLITRCQYWIKYGDPEDRKFARDLLRSFVQVITEAYA